MPRPAVHPLTPKLESLLSWSMPPLIIPLLRWFQDPPELRWKLFTRDFSTYSIGAAIFLGGRPLLRRVLVGFIPTEGSRELCAFLLALGANLAYAGIGALKLSKWIETQWHQMLLRHKVMPSQPVFPSSRGYLPGPHPGMPVMPLFPSASWPSVNIINVIPK